jgi:hypothetical protein
MVAHVGLIIVHHSPPIVTPASHGLCLLSTPVFREAYSLAAWIVLFEVPFNSVVHDALLPHKLKTVKMY